MNKSILTQLAILLLLHLNTKAQDRKIFKINPGEKVVYTIPFSEKYDSPAFRKGTVQFRNGAFGDALMNFNVLFGEMQFIDPKGDTLSISDPAAVKYITLDSNRYYFDKEYVRLIHNYDGVTLGDRQAFEFVNRQKLGGFGELNSASIDTYNALSSSSIFKDLIAREILTLGKYRYFYIGDAFGRFARLNKKSLLNAFPKKSKELSQYLKERAVDLNNEEEIKKLLTHFSQ